MRYLLDTDFVIDYLTGQVDANETLAHILPEGIAISVITYSELHEAVHASHDPAGAHRVLETFLQGMPILLVTRSVARQAATIRIELRQSGRRITHRALDLLIAAIAIDRNLVLVTRNTTDYQDIPGLMLYYSSAARQ